MAASSTGTKQSNGAASTQPGIEILSILGSTWLQHKKEEEGEPTNEKKKAENALQAIKGAIEAKNKAPQANKETHNDLSHPEAAAMMALIEPDRGVNALKKTFANSIVTFNKTVMDSVDTAPDITKFNAEMRKDLKIKIDNCLFPLSTGKGVIGTFENLRTMTSTLIELRKYQAGVLADSGEGDVFPYEGIAMAAIYMYRKSKLAERQLNYCTN
jgi:hypothetical protein